MLRPWALVLLAALALSATTASAQEPTASTLVLGEPQVDSLPLAPGGVPANVTVPWTYTFANAAAAATATRGASLQWASVGCASEGITLSGPATESIALQPGQTTYSGVGRFSAVATMDAPAEEQIPCTFTAFVEEASPAVPRTDNATATVPVTVAFRGVLSLDIESNTVEAAPGEPAVFLLSVTNFSNGPAQVNVGMVGAPQPEGSWEVILPEPIVLDSGASTEVAIQVQGEPSGLWTSREGTGVFSVWASSTRDAAVQGDATEVNVLARVEGFSLMTLQTVWVLLLLAAVAGGIVFLRRRKGKGSKEGKGGNEAKEPRGTKVLAKGKAVKPAKGQKAAKLDEALRASKGPAAAAPGKGNRKGKAANG